MKYLKLKFLILIFIAFNLSNLSSFGQNLPINLTNVNIDDLSDSQIKGYLHQAQNAGLSDGQIIENDKNAGMSNTNAQKLEGRFQAIRKLETNDGQLNNGQSTTRALNYTPDAVSGSESPPSRIFGADLFRNIKSSFEPNLRLATPVNYMLGPDDVLDISVYGNSVVNWKLPVSPEGNINMPSGGILNVAGKSIEAATAAIKSRLISKNYKIGNGSYLSVTLGDIRSIKVIMAGEVVRPGTITLSSLATAFNALSLAGGPNDNGSFRKIAIIRNNKVLRYLDIYDFLVNNNEKDNIALQDQDIIQVPTYNTRVEMRGAIKRPLYFEVLPGESLEDVIRFAGGFTDNAYRASINVSQINDRARRLTDVKQVNYKDYKPSAGDIFTVGTINNSYENRVIINGAVNRPGIYELQNDMTLSQLINKAAGLKEDAFTEIGTITRLNPDSSIKLVSFNLTDVMNKSIIVPLQREDVVNIQSVFDLHDQNTVQILGEVRRPGNFAYADSMNVENLILMAGGFKEGGSNLRIEVARRVYDSDPSVPNSTTAKVFTTDVSADFKPNSASFSLKPFDVVLVYRLPGFEKQGLVKVEGEVTFSGPYAIESKTERISDILKRAGGVSAAADIDASTLKRTTTALLGVDKDKIDTLTLLDEHNKRIDEIKHGYNDSTQNDEPLRNNYIGINLRQIIKTPGSPTDLILKDGDILTIPQIQQIVQVNGEIHVPSSMVYIPGKTFKQYIINAGGYSNQALRRGAYVINRNGSVEGTRKFLFFNVYPKVKPGSELYVPRKSLTHGFNVGTLVGLISALGTTVILAIISFRN